MLYTIILTNNALLDIQDAIDWENNRKQGLSEILLEDLEERFTVIAESPEIWAIRYDNVRCAVTSVFSYLVHYVIDEPKHQILITRVFHTSRKQIW